MIFLIVWVFFVLFFWCACAEDKATGTATALSKVCVCFVAPFQVEVTFQVEVMKEEAGHVGTQDSVAGGV